MGYVMDKYARLLWNIAAAVLKCGGNEQDIEECVADAFIYLWRNPGKFRPEQGSLKSWLCIIVRSRAIDRFRQNMRNSALPLEEAALVESVGLQEILLQKETKAAVAEAVGLLEEPNREILIRRYYFGQKPKEIALALGLTVKQVDNSLYRSKQQLRARLSKEEGGLT